MIDVDFEIAAGVAVGCGGSLTSPAALIVAGPTRLGHRVGVVFSRTFRHADVFLVAEVAAVFAVIGCGSSAGQTHVVTFLADLK